MVQCRPGRLINILNHEDGKEVSVQGGVADIVGVGGAAWDELQCPSDANRERLAHCKGTLGPCESQGQSKAEEAQAPEGRHLPLQGQGDDRA